MKTVLKILKVLNSLMDTRATIAHRKTFTIDNSKSNGEISVRNKKVRLRIKV